MTLDELKAAASAVAVEIAGVVADGADGTLPEALRRRFISVRTELFNRGIFDPVLARSDSGTVAPASLREIAEELAKVAEHI